MIQLNPMKARKIVYISAFCFDERDYERFGVNLLLQRGYTIEIYFLAYAFSPEVHPYLEKSGVKTYYFSVSDIQKSYRCLAKIKNSHILMQTMQLNLLGMPQAYKTILKRKKRKNNITYIPIAGGIPMPNFDQYIEREKQELKQENISKKIHIKTRLYLIKEHLYNNYKAIRNLLGYIYYKKWTSFKDLFIHELDKIKKNISAYFYFKQKNIGVVDYALYGGVVNSLIYKDDFPVGKDTIVKWYHNHDVDLMIKEKNNERAIKQKYIVFIDEFTPFHPDYAISGRESPVTADTYYQEYNNFFSMLEKNIGIQVVIAAHPRSDYEIRGNPYEGRTLIKGQTANLIRYAEFVLAYTSTAKGMAVYYNKHIINTQTDELKSDPIEQGCFISQCKSLGVEGVNISHITENDIRLMLLSKEKDKNSYKDYIDMFCINTKQNKNTTLLFWELFERDFLL